MLAFIILTALILAVLIAAFIVLFIAIASRVLGKSDQEDLAMWRKYDYPLDEHEKMIS